MDGWGERRSNEQECLQAAVTYIQAAEEGWQSVDELDFGRGKVEDTGRYEEVICRGIVAVHTRIRFAPRRLVGGVRKTRPRSSLRGTKQLSMQ